jgi:hypothetical protein
MIRGRFAAACPKTERGNDSGEQAGCALNSINPHYWTQPHESIWQFTTTGAWDKTGRPMTS